MVGAARSESTFTARQVVSITCDRYTTTTQWLDEQRLSYTSNEIASIDSWAEQMIHPSETSRARKLFVVHIERESGRRTNSNNETVVPPTERTSREQEKPQ